MNKRKCEEITNKCNFNLDKIVQTGDMIQAHVAIDIDDDIISRIVNGDENELLDEIKRKISEESGLNLDDFEFVLCRGCIEEQPNQLAHMEPGGCLYQNI